MFPGRPEGHGSGVTSVRVHDGRLAAARPLFVTGWVGALAATLAVLAATAGWRGADTPNYEFRIELFRRAGFTIWSSAWYGGHHTLGYSLLVAPVAATLGPVLVGSVSAVVAAVCLERLIRRLPDVQPRRAIAASALFAAGTVVNLAVGRLAFALGLALGLAALAAGRRTAVAGMAAAGLSVGTTLASPVAGCSWRWLGRPSRSPTTSADLWWAACALVPVGVLASCSPKAGASRSASVHSRSPSPCASQRGCCCPARGPRCGSARRSMPPRAPHVRGAQRVGANITRLGMFVALPLLVAAPLRRPRGVPPVAMVVLGLLFAWWQWPRPSTP